MKHSLIISVLALLLLRCSSSSSVENPEVAEPVFVRIAAAANTRFALTELSALYEEQYPEVTLDIVFNSSGKLVAQIENGAPFDMFFSADLEKCEYLKKDKFSNRQIDVYAQGLLVAWTSDKTLSFSASTLPDLLTSEEITKVAIADPVTAPYGSAAMNYLKKMGISDQVKPKLKIGSSISQTTQYIASGLVDLGFTAKSIVKADELRDIGYWITMDEYLIEQGSMLLISQEDQDYETSSAVYEFLVRDAAARKVWQEYGYK